MNRTITIRLDDKLAEKLEMVIEETGHTRSGFIRYALNHHLPRMLEDTDRQQAPDPYPPFPDEGEGPLVSEPKENPVKQKAYSFALDIIRLYQQLQDQREYVISKQLLRSGTSIGANVEEATAAESRRDFLHKMNIASKEARETNYWLRLLRDSKLVEKVDIEPHVASSYELVKMLTAIVKTTART
jgi:four helix bundle protein